MNSSRKRDNCKRYDNRYQEQEVMKQKSRRAFCVCICVFSSTQSSFSFFLSFLSYPHCMSTFFPFSLSHCFISYTVDVFCERAHSIRSTSYRDPVSSVNLLDYQSVAERLTRTSRETRTTSQLQTKVT